MAINREDLVGAANSALSDILYTAISDTANEVIVTLKDVDEAAVLKAANTVITKYLSEGIKIRKKPAPRERTAPSKAKPKALDLFSAAQKKKNDQVPITNWMKHPNDSRYSFAPIEFATGYPLRSNATGKLIGMITDDDTHPPTKEDIKIAQTYSLEIDIEN